MVGQSTLFIAANHASLFALALELQKQLFVLKQFVS